MHKHLALLFLCLLLNGFIFAQDDSEADAVSTETFTREELQEEKKRLDFEKYFIESIQQKSIENYDKALEALRICETLFSDTMAVPFEMAKNYFALKQYTEAQYYCDRSLHLEPDNFWVKALLRDIYIKQQNYAKAIELQKELYASKPSEAEKLLRLYYKTKAIAKGKQLLAEIEKKSIPVEGFNFYRKFFNKNVEDTGEIVKKKAGKEKDITALQQEFAQNKDYATLKILLSKEASSQKYDLLLKDSTTGLELFPVQAVVYLYKGIALNGLHRYEKAISVLESGLEFVFDDKKLLKQFYETLIQACLAADNKEKVALYKQLIQKL